MKNLLIISSTNNTNLELSKEIKSFLVSSLNITSKIISLEEFNIPLYTPTLEESFKGNSNFPKDIISLKSILLNSKAIIWCSPEYNGGVPPIITNSIAWISRSTDDWKEAFNKKNMLICSSSGGNGKNFVFGFKSQLSYLGSRVFENSIIKTKKNNFDPGFFEETLVNFCNLLK